MSKRRREVDIQPESESKRVAPSHTRRVPNILITGTPGTGKSSTARQLVARDARLRHVDVGALVNADPAGLAEQWCVRRANRGGSRC